MHNNLPGIALIDDAEFQHSGTGSFHLHQQGQPLAGLQAYYPPCIDHVTNAQFVWVPPAAPETRSPE